MRLTDFIREDLVVPDLAERTKEAVLNELAGHFAARFSTVDRAQLLEVLSERERIASTAIGQGVAIPHAKLDSVQELVGCVARAPGGIAFGSLDGQPTQLFFVLVAPPSAAGIHLKALARISRLFRDPGFRTRLLTAQSAQDMFRTLADEDAKY